MLIVCDTSPLIALRHVELLDFIEDLFERVVAPAAVARELATGSSTRSPFDLATYPRFEILTPSDEERVSQLEKYLHRGEAEAIALAIELQPCVLMIDERRGRQVAAELRLQHTGAIGILIEAKRRGRIASIRQCLNSLESGIGFRLSAELKRAALRIAGEDEHA